MNLLIQINVIFIFTLSFEHTKNEKGRNFYCWDDHSAPWHRDCRSKMIAGYRVEAVMYVRGLKKRQCMTLHSTPDMYGFISTKTLRIMLTTVGALNLGTVWMKICVCLCLDTAGMI